MSARARASQASVSPGPELTARPDAISSSRPAICRLKSPIASSAGCVRTGESSRPAASPAAAPASVSITRPVAAALVSKDRISIALIGTSRMWSPSLSLEPMASAAATVRPRLHHVNPTAAESPSATSTPATTLATR